MGSEMCIRDRNETARRAIIWILRVLIVVAVFVGATSTPGTAWALGDIGVGATAWLNIVAILFLQVPAMKCLWDYRRQKKAGLEPQFDPEALGIKNAEFWEERKREMIEAGTWPGVEGSVVTTNGTGSAGGSTAVTP